MSVLKVLDMHFKTGSTGDSLLYTNDLYLTFLYTRNCIASTIMTVMIMDFTNNNGLGGITISSSNGTVCHVNDSKLVTSGFTLQMFNGI